MSSYKDVTREVKSESDRLIKRFLDSTKSLCFFNSKFIAFKIGLFTKKNTEC